MNPIFFAMLMKWLRGGFVVALALMAFPTDAATVRSQAAKRAFARTHVCPSTGRFALPCPGNVIDHIEALACGGADKPWNMQYQTIAESKAKDKIERLGCKAPTQHRKKKS